ncbi:MAG: FliG C-terminal domain-containing protein [Pirellulaceae bacterium]
MTPSRKFAMPPSLRKAAILVAALDRQCADALLEEMGPEDAARVRAAVMDLDDVSEEDQQQVMADFIRCGPQTTFVDSSGIELDDSLAKPLANDPIVPETAAAESGTPEPPPFRFLHEATTDGLAKHLQREHPQVIAVVVAHLKPKQGADLIKRFPEALQVDVLRRVAELDTTSPEVLRDLENQLEVLLSDEIRVARNRSAGVSAVASILEAAGADRADLLDVVSRNDAQLMSLIAQNDAEQHSASPRRGAHSSPRQTEQPARNREPGVADQRRSLESSTGQRRHPPQVMPGPSRAARHASHPRSKSIPRRASVTREPDAREGIEFEDLVRLDDRELATLFQAADPQMVVLALTGAEEDLVRRILRQFPSEQSKKLQRQMKNLGPIQLADVERAQRIIARLASQLASRNLIRFPQTRRFAIAA